MEIEIFEVMPCPAGRLATMPRPRGGDWLRGEITSLKSFGVTDLVSMLSPEEEIGLGLLEEGPLCAEFGIGFHRHPTNDRCVPAQPAFDGFVSSLLPILLQGGFIAIHCRAGIGRSSITAAALLCALGVPAIRAIALISHARGILVPDTSEQEDFIMSLESPRGPLSS